MAYDVQTAVFEGPFDLLLHLILREQVDLYEVSLADHRRRLPGRARPRRGPRPRRRHRVPAHRRHPGRAEGPAPAARATTTSTSTTSWPCGRSATCCSPACSSARPSRTPPRALRAARRRGRALAAPAAPGSTSASSTSPPTCSPASPPPTSAPPSCGRRPPSRCRASTCDHVAPVAAQRHRGRRRAGRRAAPGRAHRVPRPHRVARRAARGGRALPGRPRAVQAGPGRPRAGHAPSATSTIVWLGGDGRGSTTDADLRCRRLRRLSARGRRVRRVRGTGRAVPTTRPTGPSRPILMVAEEPVDPQLLAQLLEVSAARVDELCAELAAEYEARGPRLRARQGGRRLPLPEPPRPGRLRRAVRARGPVAPASRRRPSRRWPSSPTSSRSRGPRWRPSAASTSTA